MHDLYNQTCLPQSTPDAAEGGDEEISPGRGHLCGLAALAKRRARHAVQVVAARSPREGGEVTDPAPLSASPATPSFVDMLSPASRPKGSTAVLHRGTSPGRGPNVERMHSRGKQFRHALCLPCQLPDAVSISSDPPICSSFVQLLVEILRRYRVALELYLLELVLFVLILARHLPAFVL